MLSVRIRAGGLALDSSAGMESIYLLCGLKPAHTIDFRHAVWNSDAAFWQKGGGKCPQIPAAKRKLCGEVKDRGLWKVKVSTEAEEV